jgi:hypothetical protein
MELTPSTLSSLTDNLINPALYDRGVPDQVTYKGREFVRFKRPEPRYRPGKNKIVKL